jgi:hypothetical protein
VAPDFVTVEKIAPGDEIEISFGFRIKDFGLAEDAEIVQFQDGTGSGDDVAIEPPTDQAAAIDLQGLSEVKKRILARLGTEALVDDGGGFVVHARHRVSFVEQQRAGGKAP